MHRCLPLLMLLGALFAATPAAAAAAPFTFPSTCAGGHIQAWFAAYGSGEEAMRRFIEGHVSAAGLAARPLKDRLSGYGAMRSDLGDLTPISVGESSEDHVVVRARAAGGDEVNLVVQCEPAPSRALASIRVERFAGGDGPPPAEDVQPARDDAQLAAAVRARVNSLAAAGAFSGAVLVTHGAATVVREARGMASRERHVPNTPATRFNLGSINKAFTRVAIEQLAAQGKLKLDDTIDHYLPDYPADKGHKVTIAQLLAHRGGTGDIFNARYDAMDVGKLRTIADWMELIRDQPLEFEPGTQERYSNAGYVLLGAIIEKLSGQSYYDYVREHVFQPAGMTATGSYARDDAEPARATGYTQEHGKHAEWQPNTSMLPGRGSSAGGGYSTLDDLHRFADALRSGVLKASTFTGGFGIAGGSEGVNGVLESQDDWTVIVLANLDPPAAEKLAQWIRRQLPPPSDGSSGGMRRVIRAGDGGAVGAEGAGGADGAPAGTRRVVQTSEGDGMRGGVRTRMRAGAGDDPDRKPKRTVLPAGGIDVPMTRSGPLVVVSVKVNGQGPFRFGIDTGGAGTARIDTVLAAKLGLKTIGEVQAGDPTGRAARTMPLVAVDSIEMGGAHFVGLTAPVRSYARAGREEPIDGILGFGLFADALLTLDYPAGRLRVTSGSLPEADGAEVLDYTDERGVPSVRMDVAGEMVDADLDAGSMGGFGLPEAWAGKLALKSEPQVVGHARTVTGSFDIKAAPMTGAITIGKQRFDDPMVEFVPFPVANVGGRILGGFRVTFDQRHHRVRFERGEPAGGAARSQ